MNDIETAPQSNNDLKRTVGHSFILLLGTLVWGFAFVAQRKAGEVIGAYTFTSTRFLIAGVLLLIVCALRRKKVERDIKKLLIGGTVCGLFLSLASNLQQLGINLGTSAGKAGFITAMYIILVPIIGALFYRKKTSRIIWISVIIALVSLYLLCMKESFSFQISDLLILGCALVFAFQILSIDKYSIATDPLELSCVEFLICGASSCIPMLIFDLPQDPNAWAYSFTTLDAWIPLLYAAIMSSGVGYTLQTVGQKGINPTIAAVIMSFESVFAALAGWLILHEILSTKEIVGCVLMFVAVIVAQIPFDKLIKKSRNTPDNT